MSRDPKSININNYSYELPEHRIAKFPLEERDASKLLVYREGKIGERIFRDISGLLPQGSLLLFNDTKVIHARLYFELPNDKRLEILCLEPLNPGEYQRNFSSRSTVHWKCLVGNNRRWKSGEISKLIDTPQGPTTLTARRLSRLSGTFEVEFSWDNPALAFGELLAAGGIIPLPPYLNRQTEASDEERYQTVYAREKGSVAAPTAGLHFTERVFEDLDGQGIQRAFVTLHVGAGTFKPVSAEQLADHHMHEESIYLQRTVLDRISGAIAEGKPIIPVGTTSMRLLESLYWHGCALWRGTDQPHINVQQWMPYEDKPTPGPQEALAAIARQMDEQQIDVLQGYTQLIIAPGYEFRFCKGLITNFHQPKSTLLLLIAALIGEDWKKVYDFALANNFRFLSYGDSSLLMP